MKIHKLMILVLSIIGTSVVVFNNLTDLIQKIFNPIFNYWYFLSLLILMIPCVWYVLYNWRK